MGTINILSTFEALVNR